MGSQFAIRNKQVFYLLRIMQFGALGIWVPLQASYFLFLGFEPADFAFMFQFVILVMVAMEVPSGILADRWGRKKTLIVAGCCLLIMELILLFCAFYRPEIHIAWPLIITMEVFFGTGLSLMTGTDAALLWESLPGETAKKEAQFTKTFGWSRLFENLAMATGSLGAGWLFAKTEYFPAVAGACLALTYIVIASRSHDPLPVGKVGSAVAAGSPSKTAQLGAKLRQYLNDLKVGRTWWLILFYGAWLSFGSIFRNFSQFALLAEGWTQASISNAYALGSLVAGGIAVWFVTRGPLRISELTGMIITSTAMTLCFVGLSTGNSVVTLALVLLFLTNDFFGNAYLLTYINPELSSSVRATMISISMFVSRILSSFLAEFFKRPGAEEKFGDVQAQFFAIAAVILFVLMPILLGRVLHKPSR